MGEDQTGYEALEEVLEGEVDECPDKIYGDFGSAFTMGMIAGFVWHGGKAFRRTSRRLMREERSFGGKYPRSYKWRYLYLSSWYACKRKGLKTAMSFGLWGFLYPVFDCFLGGIRGVDDTINHATAGFLTGAVSSMRRGTRAMVKNGLLGAAILGGFDILLNMNAQGFGSGRRVSDYEMFEQAISEPELAGLFQVETDEGEGKPDVTSNMRGDAHLYLMERELAMRKKLAERMKNNTNNTNNTAN